MGNIFLSSSSENNETDAELNQNEREYINHIFRNNGFTPLESRTQIIKENAEKSILKDICCRKPENNSNAQSSKNR